MKHCLTLLQSVNGGSYFYNTTFEDRKILQKTESSVRMSG